jgi:signal transduction histidine kinase
VADRVVLARVATCSHLLTSPELVDHLAMEGAYLVTPHWVADWEGRLRDMGCDHELAAQMLGESCRRVVLLDTGVDPAARDNAAAFAEAIGLPWERMPVGTRVLARHIAWGLAELEGRMHRGQISRLRGEAADHAMAADLLSRIASADSESTAAAHIADACLTLFAPKSIGYLGIDDDGPIAIGALEDPDLKERVTDWAGRSAEAYTRTMVTDGFVLRLRRGDHTVGVVYIGEVAFPHELDRYIRVALNIAGPCALSVENARVAARARQAEEESRALAASLERSQRLESLGVLAGGTAHHLNNALTAIVGYASMGQEQAEATSLQHKAFEVIARQAERAAEMTSRMLQFIGWRVRGESPVDLVALAGEAVDEIRREFGSAVVLARELPDQPLRVRGNGPLLAQCLESILRNAVEALDDDAGQVLLAMRPTTLSAGELASTYVDDGLPGGEYAEVRVADTGRGMDEATQTAMFEPFFSTKELGRGLEMAAALGIVRAHSGAISVRSSPGEGTEVTVYLPLVAHGDDEAQPRA